MGEVKHYIAIDLGAESERVMLGTLAEGKLTLEEVHRFANGPMEMAGSLRWDFEGMLAEIRTGLAKAVKAAGGEVRGISADSWGVDFGLFDEAGNLIEPPYHYRDSRTEGMLEQAFARMPKREIYEHTGIQFMQLNTLFQLLAMKLGNHPALQQTHRITFMADCVAHALCGRLYAEYTLASTSHIMNLRTSQWAGPVLNAMGLPAAIMPEIIKPCTVVGVLREELAQEIGAGPIPIIAAASHDTAAAVAAVPAEGGDWAYLSSGTWSLMGVEVSQPVINDQTFGASITNEGGVAGTIRLLKNIIGLWLLQECRRQWQREGDDLSYGELADLAATARPFAARIEVDDAGFIAPGDMPARINDHLRRAGREPLTDRGEIVRSILEALAFTYRGTLDTLAEILDRRIDVIHIVGGGTQNELLNQFAANATNRKVVTGPIEATSIGNVLLQALALGDIDSLPALRAIVRASFPLKEYTPRESDAWQREYAARTAAQ